MSCLSVKAVFCEFPLVEIKQMPGGVLPESWVGMCGPLPKTVTLFMTKICDIPYRIYDLTKKFETLFMARPLNQKPVSDLRYN